MKLPDRWLHYLRTMPETGMGYQVVDIELRDGRIFKQAIIDSGHLTRIRGVAPVPFTESDNTQTDTDELIAAQELVLNAIFSHAGGPLN